MLRFPVASVWLVLIVCLAAAVGADDEPMIELGPAAGQKTSEKPAEKGDAKEPVKPKADPTGQEPFAGGVIEGKILPAKRVKSVRLVERSSGRSRDVVYDPRNGHFAVDRLPPGTWAVEVGTPWGLVQGVDMRWRPDDPNRAGSGTHDGRKKKPLDDADREEIIRWITKADRFMKTRPLVFKGDGRRVTVLVEKLRDTAFHKRKGDQVIWRLEAWHFEDRWGTWERVGGKVIFRERLSGAVFRKRTRQFVPELGGLEITDRTTKPLAVEYTVPELPTRSRGPVAEGQETAAEKDKPAEKAPSPAAALKDKKDESQ
ncbi:MAG: hypothetical protein GWP05_01935 [Anaerolineaceae bacterium]|nr:hypothetical protein [Anaerolineaceae bacterium]